MTLVIMAAGMGSRFGGLKQIEPIDPSGHILIDYSVYDAIGVGFDRVVFVIRRENELVFKEILSPRLKKWKIRVDLVYQETDDLPSGIICPKERTKPWGTAHAVASLSGKIKEPFALINADDFYGAEAFKAISEFLSHSRAGELCMIGYRLKNTLSKNGTVSRGVCKMSGDNLAEINETSGVFARENRILSDSGELSPDSIVSMNFWGLSPEIIGECKARFATFLREKSEKELKVCEFYLPKVISELINEGKYRVKVIECDDPWYGITYKEDRVSLSSALEDMKQKGKYPYGF